MPKGIGSYAILFICSELFLFWQVEIVFFALHFSEPEIRATRATPEHATLDVLYFKVKNEMK